MHTGLMIALQVAALASVRPDFAPAPSEERARRLAERQQPGCASLDASDEIVVCGRRDLDRFRVPPLPGGYEEGPPRAETSLGGKVKGSVDVDQAEVGGFTSPRAKVTIKVPF